MKIAILQDVFTPSAWTDNYKKISDFYKKACREKSDFAIVPSEAVCGYEPKSLLEYTEHIEKITSLQKKLIKETHADTPLIFDTPFALDGSFIPSFCAAANGKLQFSAEQFPLDIEGADIQDNIFNFRGKRIFISYLSQMVMSQVDLNPEVFEDMDLVVFLEARPFMVEKESARRELLRQLALRFHKMVYVSQGGGLGDVVLTGASAFYSEAECKLQLPYFKSDMAFFEEAGPEGKSHRGSRRQPEPQIALIHDALVAGIRGYFKKTHIKKAVVGLSGGIDSAVVLPLAVEALGRRNVTGIMMPSQFSSDHSVNDAVQEAENLQIYYEIIPIEPLYKTFMKQLAPVFGNTPFGLAEENLQARIRGNLLMAVANKTGAMLLNTSNKSESACGYGTMYGDMCGGLAVIGDLYKSQVYALAGYINRKKEIIPQNCIDKMPSAELRPGQKDSDSLPAYDLIEKVLREYLEDRKDVREIVKDGVDKDVVLKVIGLLHRNEYKRRQAPPAIRISGTVLASDCQFPM